MAGLSETRGFQGENLGCVQKLHVDGKKLQPKMALKQFLKAWSLWVRGPVNLVGVSNLLLTQITG